MKRPKKPIFTAKRLSSAHQYMILKQLGELTQNGFSLQQSIDFLIVILPSEKKRLIHLLKLLKQGRSLAVGLKIIGIERTLTHQIAIAQAHGNLSECLLQLSKIQLMKSRQLKKCYQMMLYPIIILSFLGLLLIFVKTNILPQMADVQGENPLLKLLWRVIGVGFMLFLMILGFTYLYLKRISGYKKAKFRIHLPLVAKAWRNYYFYMLTFDLATLLKNGLKLTEICRLTKQFEKGSYLYEMGRQLEFNLKQGIEIKQFMNHHQFIPMEVSFLCQRGHSIEHLSQEMFMLAQIQYENMLSEIEKLIIKIQPLLFLVVAVLIVAVYLSVLMPIYQMMEGF